MEPKKQNLIYQRLKEQITTGNYQLWSKLPGENQLKRTYGVARETLRGALKRLEQEHLIRRIHGKGTFVRYRPETTAGLRRILFVSWNPPVYCNKDTPGYELYYCSFDDFKKLKEAEMDAFLRDHNIYGIIHCGCSFKGTEDMLSILDNAPVPVVLPFAMRTDLIRTKCSGSYMDMNAGWEIGLRHLHECGHKRIASLTPSRSGNIFNITLDKYIERLEKIGCDTRRDYFFQASFKYPDNKILPQPETLELIKADVERMLALPEPPTAFMCHNDHWAPAVYRALKVRQLRIPEDVAVMGFVANFDHESLTPPLSSVQINYRTIMQNSLELLEKVQRTPGTRYISELTYELQIRASTVKKRRN